MSDPVLQRRAALADVVVPAALGVTEQTGRLRYSLRCGEAAYAAVEAALGFALPVEACRSTSKGARAALWLGPDEWLLLTDEGDDLAVALKASLGDRFHSLVDVSERQASLLLDHPQVEALLNGACALDLAETAFPVGACTRTLLGKAEIGLWRLGPTRFQLEVWRSFCPYVAGLIQAHS